ncbi:MAG TPA: glycogen-binding domain-containing protein [Gemmatimonadaceae bacterium]
MKNRTIITASVTATLAGLALAVVPAAAQQSSATIEASSSRLRYAGDTATSGAFTVSPTLHAARANASLDMAGGLSQFTAGGWSMQGLLAGAAFTPWRPIVGELAGTTGGSVHADGNRTAESLASVRLHAVRGGVGAWLGGSVGQTWDSLGWHDVRGTEGGLWVERGGFIATASVAPTRVADSTSFTDVQLAMRALAGRADFGATIGARSGDRAALGSGARGWVNASVALWVARDVAITASAGRYPADPLQGYQAATYGAIGLRVGLRDLGASPERSSAPDRAPAPGRVSRPLTRVDRATSEAARTISGFELRSAGAGQRIVRLRAPGARRVEVAGDFTSWQPVALVGQGDGWWTATVPIAAGTYEMNVRVDGGEWLSPPGLTTLADEAGGVVGVLVVPNR